jgi:hypothetical protein
MLVFVVVKKVRAGLRMFSGDAFFAGCAMAGAKAHLLLLAFFRPGAQRAPRRALVTKPVQFEFFRSLQAQLILLAFIGPGPRGHPAVPWLQSLSNLNFSAARKAQLILLAFIGPGPRGHPGVRCYKARPNRAAAPCKSRRLRRVAESRRDADHVRLLVNRE